MLFVDCNCFAEAKQVFKDDGAEYILEHFDTYFSVVHYAESLQADLVVQVFVDLHKGWLVGNKSN